MLDTPQPRTRFSSVVVAAIALVASPLEVDAIGSAHGEWRWGVPGEGFGSSGLEIVDVDGDGTSEILGASTWGYTPDSHWMTLRKADGLQPQFASPVAPSWLGRLVTVPALDHPGVDIVLFQWPNLEVVDGRDGRLLRSIPTGVSTVYGLEVDDVDLDGSLDVVLCDEWAMEIYDYSSGAPRSVPPGLGCTYLAVGQLDTDPQLEIVLSGGGAGGQVLDGISLVDQGTVADGMAGPVALADFDLDGISEIVDGYGPNGETRVLDALTGAVLCVVSQDPATALLADDVDRDLVPELVMAQFIVVSAFDVPSGDLLWAVEGEGLYATALASGNLDDDEAVEVAWGVAGPLSANEVFVVDSDSKEIEATFERLDGGFVSLESVDSDHDGGLEVVAASNFTSESYPGGRYVVLDPRARAIRQWGPWPDYLNLQPLYALTAADLDQDGEVEICVGIDEALRGRVSCRALLKGVDQWSFDLSAGEGVLDLMAADIHPHAGLEVVVGTHAFHTGAPYIGVLALAGDTGSLLWRYIWPGWSFGGVGALAVAGVAPGPGMAVIAGRHGTGIVVLDGSTGSVSAGPFPFDVSAIATGKLDLLPGAELVIGTNSGGILAVNAMDGSSIPIGVSTSSPVAAIQVEDVTLDGVPDVVYVSGQRLSVRDGATHLDSWSSEYLGVGAGELGGLRIGDFVGDETRDAAIASWRGVSFIPLTFTIVFRDGFESGGTGNWDAVEPTMP